VQFDPSQNSPDWILIANSGKSRIILVGLIDDNIVATVMAAMKVTAAGSIISVWTLFCAGMPGRMMMEAVQVKLEALAVPR